MAKYLTGPLTKVWHLGGTPLPKLSLSAPRPPPRTPGVDEPPVSDLPIRETIECLFTEGDRLRESNYRGSFRRRGPDTSTF